MPFLGEITSYIGKTKSKIRETKSKIGRAKLDFVFRLSNVRKCLCC